MKRSNKEELNHLRYMPIHLILRALCSDSTDTQARKLSSRLIIRRIIIHIHGAQNRQSSKTHHQISISTPARVCESERILF